VSFQRLARQLGTTSPLRSWHCNMISGITCTCKNHHDYVFMKLIMRTTKNSISRYSHCVYVHLSSSFAIRWMMHRRLRGRNDTYIAATPHDITDRRDYCQIITDALVFACNFRSQGIVALNPNSICRFARSLSPKRYSACRIQRWHIVEDYCILWALHRDTIQSIVFTS
jgi:hypothetical protein